MRDLHAIYAVLTNRLSDVSDPSIGVYAVSTRAYESFSSAYANTSNAYAGSTSACAGYTRAKMISIGAVAYACNFVHMGFGNVPRDRFTWIKVSHVVIQVINQQPVVTTVFIPKIFRILIVIRIRYVLHSPFKFYTILC